jgi:hypothetical protein
MTDHRTRHWCTGARRRELAASLKFKYESGATIRELADETGRSCAGVANLLRLAETRMRPKGWRHAPATGEDSRLDQAGSPE